MGIDLAALKSQGGRVNPYARQSQQQAERQESAHVDPSSTQPKPSQQQPKPAAAAEEGLAREGVAAPAASLPGIEGDAPAWWDRNTGAEDMADRDKNKSPKKKRSRKTKTSTSSKNKSERKGKKRPAFAALSLQDNKALERKNDAALVKMNRAHQKRTSKYKTDPYHRARYLRAKNRNAKMKNAPITKRERREIHKIRVKQVDKCYADRKEKKNPNKWVDVDLEMSKTMAKERLRKENKDITQQHFELYHGAGGNPRRRIQVLKHKLLRRKISPVERQELHNLTEFVRLVDFNKFSLDQSDPPAVASHGKLVRLLHLLEQEEPPLVDEQARTEAEGTHTMLAYKYLHDDDEGDVVPKASPENHHFQQQRVPTVEREVQVETDSGLHMRRMMHVILEDEIARQIQKDLYALEHKKWHLEFQAGAVAERVAALEHRRREHELQEQLYAREAMATAVQALSVCDGALADARTEGKKDVVEDLELKSLVFNEAEYAREMERRSQLLSALGAVVDYEATHATIAERLDAGVYSGSEDDLHDEICGQIAEHDYFGLESERDVVKGTVRTELIDEHNLHFWNL
jgi:hypothetical protein